MSIVAISTAIHSPSMEGPTKITALRPSPNTSPTIQLLVAVMLSRMLRDILGVFKANTVNNRQTTPAIYQTALVPTAIPNLSTEGQMKFSTPPPSPDTSPIIKLLVAVMLSRMLRDIPEVFKANTVNSRQITPAIHQTATTQRQVMVNNSILRVFSKYLTEGQEPLSTFILAVQF